MKILAGIHQPSSGAIWLEGAPVRFANAHAARKAGIAMIYQEPLPFLDLTVAENIYMGQEPVMGFAGWIDGRELRRGAERLLGELGVGLRTTARMRDLTVADMQAVEIAKALAHEAKVVIMDEPTSALSEREVIALFEQVRELKARGVALVYISHRLEEVFQLADRCTVLRDGAVVSTHAMSEVNRSGLIKLMVGRNVSEGRSKAQVEKGPVALSARRLGRRGRFQDISAL
jgi:ABC-type sugar transport system ATPase subunit